VRQRVHDVGGLGVEVRQSTRLPLLRNTLTALTFLQARLDVDTAAERRSSLSVHFSSEVNR
jgi:hypothetical protein